MRKYLVLGIVLASFSPAAALAQLHITGLAITKTCPGVANQGATVTCTITVENQDTAHGVAGLTVTNQFPFPGGAISPLSGCATSLAPGDGINGSGLDFTSCTVQETLNLPCPGVFVPATDQAVAEGTDADPIPLPTGFGGLPVAGSATNTVIETCNTPTPTIAASPTSTNTPEPTPTSTAATTDHFKCYKVKDLKNPKFVPIDDVQLDDQFGNETIDVKKPFLVCNPASKNGSGIMNADLHICCYKIRAVPLNPPAQMQITDQFGSLELEAKKAQMLCQPCTKTVLP